MVATDDVAVRSHQDVLPDRHAARGKYFAVEADVHALGKLDVAVLARQNRVAADEHAARDSYPAIAVAFRIEQAVVVDHDVVSNVNLVRMPQDDVLPEDDIAEIGRAH